MIFTFFCVEVTASNVYKKYGNCIFFGKTLNGKKLWKVSDTILVKNQCLDEKSTSTLARILQGA